MIFAGTPAFARVALESICRAGHEVVLVLTQPDRPAGRGMKLQASAVKAFALQHGLSLAQPRSLRLDGKAPLDAAATRESIQAAQADVMVVAAFGLVLPQWVLDLMRVPRPNVPVSGLGCLNIHASLLPRWRGAAPIHRAIEAGDLQTGITIMQMDAGLDTGDMLLRQTLPILPNDTTGQLHDHLATLGGQMLVQALDLAAQRSLPATRQPASGVTYAHKVDKAEALIDWHSDAALIVRRMRAFDPTPGCHALLRGESIKVWAAQLGEPTDPGARLGSIVALAPDLLGIAAMNNVVNLLELQRPGGRRMPVAEFLRGANLALGDGFDLVPPPAPGR